MKHQLGLLLLVGLGTCALAADTAVVEEIIAKVNGDIITRGELAHTRAQLESELRANKLSDEELRKRMAEQQKDLLRTRIDELLLQQKGKDLNINVDSEVSKYIADIRRRANIADDEKWAEYVRQNTGQSVEDFKADIKNRMLTQRVVGQEVYQRNVKISRDDARKFYEANKAAFVRQEQVFLREIFLSTADKSTVQVNAIEKKAKDIAGRAKRGEKFGELARDNSDAESAKEYGQLPPMKKGELDPALESVVWNKDKGFVTDPIKRPNGWLILRVDEHFKAGQATFEEVEQQIMGKLGEEQVEPKLREYLTKLRQEAFLEIKPGYVDTGAAPGKKTEWTDPAKLTPATTTKEEVLAKGRRRRLLGMVPVPGTKSAPKTAATGVSSSKSLAAPSK